ncbi:MAG: AAA family ATPase [Eubacteriales bacterium]
MLEHLHVKNLALIREAEIDFTEGLNILTGETGAGKSIVIGSVSLALGGKVSKDLVRPGADYGLAELVFSVTGERLESQLRSWTWFGGMGHPVPENHERQEHQ